MLIVQSTPVGRPLPDLQRDVKDVMMEAGKVASAVLEVLTQHWRPMSRVGLPLKTGSAQRTAGGGGSGFAAGANTFGVGVRASATRAVQAATAATGHAALDGGRAAAAQALASAVPAPIMQALQLLLQNLPQANKGGEKKGNY
ncbi:hypothetical protein KFL_001520210 [Klebsormidium nitens]|uniref:Uncharacterized protein n=1 Tax=Klebsormidium nitens TaxID=105231 RepID=A0A1Y1I2Z1_KLENI|nr:hypothetical protein KFL_001520210 [Klebsormidium nitens]|eukprot:GAQ83551.1 hypothetical protein KFL_001520210 [Klebsormidium nitens]